MYIEVDGDPKYGKQITVDKPGKLLLLSFSLLVQELISKKGVHEMKELYADHDS